MAVYTYTTTPQEDTVLVTALADLNAARALIGEKPISITDLMAKILLDGVTQYIRDQHIINRDKVAAAFINAPLSTQATIKATLGV